MSASVTFHMCRWACRMKSQERTCWVRRSVLSYFKEYCQALASMAPLAGVSSSILKGRGVNFQLGHMPRLWVPSWSGCMQEATNQCFSLTSVFLFLSLSLLPLSLKSTSMSSGENSKKNIVKLLPHSGRIVSAHQQCRVGVERPAFP